MNISTPLHVTAQSSKIDFDKMILITQEEYNEHLMDRQRLEWVLPLVCGGKVKGKPLDLARELHAGKKGRKAIDGAMTI